MTASTEKKKPLLIAILPWVTLGPLYLSLLGLIFSGFYWMLSGESRCLNAWDQQFQPRFSAWQCSIMQQGRRIPVPEFYSMDDVRPPEARD